MPRLGHAHFQPVSSLGRCLSGVPASVCSLLLWPPFPCLHGIRCSLQWMVPQAGESKDNQAPAASVGAGPSLVLEEGTALEPWAGSRQHRGRSPHQGLCPQEPRSELRGPFRDLGSPATDLKCSSSPDSPEGSVFRNTNSSPYRHTAICVKW